MNLYIVNFLIQQTVGLGIQPASGNIYAIGKTESEVEGKALITVQQAFPNFSIHVIKASLFSSMIIGDFSVEVKVSLK